MPDLLIELFSEEIPARMQARACADLRRLVTDGLVEAGLTYGDAVAFATPRRLCLALADLPAASAATREERKGPRTDAPDQAIEGFLRSIGLTRDQLAARDEKKGQVYYAVIDRPGRPAPEIAAEVLARVITSFPWPKSMRWGAGELRWVRPLHRILCVLTRETGAEVVPLQIGGITAGDVTEGHRFLAPGPIRVTGFDDYRAKLLAARVVLDPEDRAARIRADADNLAFAAGLEVVADDALLDEVAGLVEWPVALMGQIDQGFLTLPAEVLQTSMRTHQKFFSIRDPKTGGIARFITVANTETADHGASILKGNRKVLSARLSDARFFWDNDLRVAKSGMTAWIEGLEKVTFHAKLGSQAARVARIAALARALAPLVGADADKAQAAARIAKADLRSEMVGEFPELQGVMGRYYALEAGHDADIADAARDHWKPLGQGDDVPTAPISVAVALADKLDMLTGFWAIDEKPTGSKDPFALRRAALGVIRLVLENNLRIKLTEAMLSPVRANRTAMAGAAPNDAKTKAEVTDAALAADLTGFIHDRLKVFLRDQGIGHEVIDACLAMPGNDDLALVTARARALGAFLGTEDGANLLAGFRRANNILTAEEKKDGVSYELDPDIRFAEAAEEKALFAALDAAQAAFVPALKAEDFAAAMAAMAALRRPIDAFFDKVTVNAEGAALRRNRLCLLNRIRATLGEVADFARISG